MAMALPYDTWFKVADEDRDGMIAGAEAVRFFQRSGLAQDCLGQIWELASAGGPKLSMVQFSAAMRLVSLAQANGGRLPVEHARAIVAGVGPPVGPPRMQGLDGGTGSASFGLPGGYSPQVTGGATYGMQNTGGYVAQHTGTYSAQHTGGHAQQSYQQQLTGQAAHVVTASYSPQVTGQYAPPSAGAAPVYGQQPRMSNVFYTDPGQPGATAFVPASAADISRYQAAFVNLDTDHDGFVKGSDCFSFFLQWGLDKTLLRDIWAVVAGNAGQLDRQQFVSCLYLMDASKLRGTPPPTALPPGPFPPMAGSTGGAVPAVWSLQSQFGASGAAAPAPTFPTFGPLPPRVDIGADTAGGGPPSYVSKAPQVGADVLASFNATEKAKIAAELKQAEEREVRQHAAEEEAARARAKQAAYNAALQELMVFKSRMDVGLLQSLDLAERLQAEADATKRRYDQTYTAAQKQNAEATRVREQLAMLSAEKAEAEEKLRVLEAEIATASSMSPVEVARMDAELRALQDRVTAAEAHHAAKTQALEGFRRQREALQQQLADAQAAAASVEAEVVEGQREVDQLTAQVAIARASGNATLTSELLIKAATAYTRLYQQARRSGLGVPAQAQLSALPVLMWFDEVVAGTVDWSQEDEQGFVLVNALPDQQTPRAVQAARAKENADGGDPTAAAAGAAGAAAGGGTEFETAFGDEDGTMAPAGAKPVPARGQSQLSEMGAAASAAAAAAAAIAALFPRMNLSSSQEPEAAAPAFRPFVEGKGFGGGNTLWDDNAFNSTADPATPALPAPTGTPVPAAAATADAASSGAEAGLSCPSANLDSGPGAASSVLRDDDAIGGDDSSHSPKGDAIGASAESGAAEEGPQPRGILGAVADAAKGAYHKAMETVTGTHHDEAATAAPAAWAAPSGFEDKSAFDEGVPVFKPDAALHSTSSFVKADSYRADALDAASPASVSSNHGLAQQSSYVATQPGNQLTAADSGFDDDAFGGPSAAFGGVPQGAASTHTPPLPPPPSASATVARPSATFATSFDDDAFA